MPVRSPKSTISNAWLQQYGLPTDGSSDFTGNKPTSFPSSVEFMFALAATRENGKVGSPLV